jgi:hypothetical protein
LEEFHGETFVTHQYNRRIKKKRRKAKENRKKEAVQVAIAKAAAGK